MALYEVHTHLYASLDEDDLNWLGSRKSPRWDIYKNSYKKLYGEFPSLDILYKNQVFLTQNLTKQQKEILRSFYIYNQDKPKGFPYFQLCFDFIISLAHTDPEELKEVAIRVHEKQKEYYSEYRMMFSPMISPLEFQEKVLALIEGFGQVDQNKKKSKLILSLNREKNKFEWQYEILKDIKRKNPNDILLGIDFAGYEENDPPQNKKQFLKKAKKESLFVILYHVGESFNNKTPSSAIRWIYEVFQYGVHRIGHAIALAYDESKVENKIYIESKEERLSHLNFLKELYEQGEMWIPIDYIYQELKQISYSKDIITIKYSQQELKLHLDFIHYVISKLKFSAIIETCPTSNLMIAGYSPLSFFVKNKLTICIGADDPQILDTSLEKEFELANAILRQEYENSNEIIEQIKKNNEIYCSENLLKNFKN